MHPPPCHLHELPAHGDHLHFLAQRAPRSSHYLSPAGLDWGGVGEWGRYHSHKVKASHSRTTVSKKTAIQRSACHLLTQKAIPALRGTTDTSNPTGWTFSKLTYLTEENSVLNPLPTFISYRKGSFPIPSPYSRPMTDTMMGKCNFRMF